jgi:hypothetical protein
MLHCNIALAQSMGGPGDFAVSKQLSVSAAFAVFAMAAFALSATPLPGRPDATGAPALANAPQLQVSLKGF